MSVQTSIEHKLRKGVIGAIADSSLKRGNPLRVDAGTSSAKATLAVTVGSGNATATKTITIGGQVYKFVSSPSAANDVKIGATAADTATNLGNAINKGTGEGTTYGTGTVANASVSATVSSAVVTLSAKEAGFAGNLIKVETTETNITFTGNYLTGGIDEKFPASVGRAYTYDTTDGVAKMGGTGAFAGIMVGPGEYANWNNLFDTLCVPNGTPADLIKFGRVWVRVTGAVSRGDVPCFKQSDGSFVGVASSASAPTGYTKLDKAVFTVAADAGDIAVIELSY